jgi:hypothetical protein
MLKKKLLSRSRDMTLPDERYRAVIQTEKFLKEILSTPRVPKAIKDRARSCLRHYPNDWDMNRAAEGAPEVFQERMEDLHRFVAQGIQAQQQEDLKDAELLRGYREL